MDGSTLGYWLKVAADSNLVGWAGFLLSLVALLGGVIRPWLRGRKASPAAQLDLFNYMSVATKDLKEEVRVVVTNYGPADMRKVDVQVFDEDGTSLAATEPEATALWPRCRSVPPRWSVSLPDPQ